MIGHGYDIHRLAAGETLVLGGVTIPAESGTVAHSDGDVILHALCDAILGAAALGDIGKHFPDTDPKWKGTASVEFVRTIAAMLHERHLKVVNVDTTLILERPKISPYISAMRLAIAEALGIDKAHVSVKATTNEGLDAVGRGEAVAAHAIAHVEWEWRRGGVNE
jgi:2-C-methyl-D-erythritol 2,4-cyclodiphosphate synthase